MSSDLAIEVNSISKSFEMYARPADRLRQFFSVRKKKYFKLFNALTDVSFDVRKGETLGIIGRNGSGKSTLLQIIAGTLGANKGFVRTHGTLAALLELGSGFNPEFTGRENVFLNGFILGFSQEEMEARFESIASFADIGEHIDQPVKTYSSGMYVRLAFAVQACVQPQILIVDEALSVGDEKFQRKCFDYIERLRANGCAVILVTHSTATVEKFCQRCVLLHQGRVHGIGPASEMIDQYHALLYSDEKAYLRYLNAGHQQPVKQVREELAVTDEAEGGTANSEPGGLRAMIREWDVLDGDGIPTEAFRTGDKATIRFGIDVFDEIREIQAGLLIRTVEGVTAFGTSSLYHGKNLHEAKVGTIATFSFSVDLRLCPGIYFVTIAIAEAVSAADMVYLDRKTDVIILNVSEARTLSTGIAALPSSVQLTSACV
ncbi:ABC transporter, ATP-binding protein [Cupriavidus taiwanensis]|uniref:ABC transporter, ATP-binding protein n=1 Tax=Cupriavidus taiwanensis TaxID=164546 RepID=A0A375I982_9BURK|nr:ABC transporter ATP-binding protein [Cupriavidus taiwanensis]SPK71354.1 ABC transporter, ATP-binding protein [Cupriavidus taiwanensis]